jgi:lipopolysaccharide transport system ATP-binding protein
MSNTILKIENLSKQYRLGTVGTGTISHDLNRWWHTIRGKEDPYLKIGDTNDRATKGTTDYVWALKDINFEVQKGEVLGIIGKNGAGKSTLLKILSKVTGPTTGSIKSKGRIASLLEVGTGFHPELTGRENIYLNGAILGMTKAEINAKLDEIVAFSGCERYIDTPVKRYSSGMTVRLAFSVAAHLEPDILVVDEVLAVGDAEFQKKAIGKMQDISKGEGRTVLFVSHNMGSILQLCTKGLLLKNGNVTFKGNVEDVVSKYLKNNQSKGSIFKIKDSECNKPMFIKSVVLKNNKGENVASFKTSESIFIKINIGVNKFIHKTSIYLTVLDAHLNKIFSAEKCITCDSNYEFILKIAAHFLVAGNYQLNLFIHTPAVQRYHQVNEVCQFEVIDDASEFVKYGKLNHGFVFGNYKWIEENL